MTSNDTQTVQGTLYIIAAPSGAGKTSLVRALLDQDDRISLSVSHTTRPPRPGETDGVDYHFVSEAAFREKIDHGDFLEWAHVYGKYYGTSKSWLAGAMASGRDIILEIDWQGARQVKALIPEARGVFILPPSLEALAERLTRRQQDSAEVIAQRLAAARDDIRHADEFDYIIVNEDFAAALQDLAAVFRATRLERARQLERHAQRLRDMR